MEKPSGVGEVQRSGAYFFCAKNSILKVGTAYKDWFPRMAEYGFVEGTDFCSKMSESTGGRPALDHRMTIEMATVPL